MFVIKRTEYNYGVSVKPLCLLFRTKFTTNEEIVNFTNAMLSRIVDGMSECYGKDNVFFFERDKGGTILSPRKQTHIVYGECTEEELEDYVNFLEEDYIVRLTNL